MSAFLIGSGARPDPERLRLAQGIWRYSPLELVAQGVAAVSERMRIVYVERRGALYRWSPTHRGGPYPLLRELALFLRVDHYRLVVPVRPAQDTFIVAADDQGHSPPDALTLLELPGMVDAQWCAAWKPLWVARILTTALP
jgi:hypothetical protein